MIDRSLKAKTYSGQYYMHKYWAKKPYNIVREYIKEFSDEGDIILDPFSGYGVTVSEALKAGRLPIGVDLSPMAIFIAEHVVKPVNTDSLKAEFRKIKDDVRSKINEMYKMKCTCGENVIVTHTIWKKDDPEEIWYTCDSCGAVKRTPSLKEKREIKRRESVDPPYWVPETKLIPNSRINVKEGDKIKALFSPRNLATISILWERIQNISDKEIHGTFQFTFTSTIHQASKLVFVIDRGRKTVGSWVAGFWTPDRHFEVNVWRCFANRFKRVLKGKEQVSREIGKVKFVDSFEELGSKNSCVLKTGDAKNLSFIPDESIDYIFTDPPYGDSHPYFEQSLLWGCWLGMNFNFEEEIVISDSPVRNKDIEGYASGLKKAFKEMSRVLKRGKFVSTAFNNIGNREWNALVNAYTKTGFQFVDAVPIKASAGSVKQDSRKCSLKGCIIITLQKSQRKNTLKKGNEKFIVSLAKRLLNRKGPLTTNEFYNYLVIDLLRRNVKNDTGKDLLDIFRENFKIEEGKWR